MSLIKEKLKESIISIAPVMLIMIIISLILKFNIITIMTILISTILLIIGTTLFTLGADLSMLEIGKSISGKLLKSRNLLLICVVSFIVGIVITIAEPDLKVLATQMSAIDSRVLILSVGIGVGIFLLIAVLRIIYQINLKFLIACFYIILISLLLMSKKEIIPVAFDSGGVTTGPMSVPFILSMGIGFTSVKRRNSSENDSFGLIALCSIGPIITVLLLNLFSKNNMQYSYDIGLEYTKFSDLILNYTSEFIPILKEVAFSLLPILVVYLIFLILGKELKSQKNLKVFVGLFITLIGLVMFFIGVNVGYMQVAYLMGIGLYNKSKLLLLILGMIVGFLIVKAEPAVTVLTEQIEKLTQGSIKRSIMNNTIAVGVSVAVGISIIRVLTGISINYFLIFGYLIAILLLMITPDIFTMVAFDSGGAVSGPMTTTFLLPLIIGICYATGGNVLTDAFGVVSLVALSPLIVIQILGVIYKVKTKHNCLNNIDETIIEFMR